MDKFEKAMQMMTQMGEKERVKIIEANRKLCICEGCPTYNECAGGEEGVAVLCFG